MHTFYTFLFSILCLTPLLAQDNCEPMVSCFDQPFLGLDGLQNDFSSSGGFENGPAFYPNEYFTDFGGFWRSGWALTAQGDTLSREPNSIYSNITGSGASASPFQYIVGQDESGIQITSPDVSPASISVANTTFSYRHMKTRSADFEAFGGLSGTDNDFLLLTIQGYNNGDAIASPIEFYLADYRFLDNTRDYIVNKWEEIDLTSLGRVDSLSFHLTTNRETDLDPNPLNYFAVDEVRFQFYSSLNDPVVNYDLQIYPNPATEKIQVESTTSEGNLLIFDTFGQQILQKAINNSSNTLDVSQLQKGVYWLVVETKEGKQSQKFIKL